MSPVGQLEFISGPMHSSGPDTAIFLAQATAFKCENQNLAGDNRSNATKLRRIHSRGRLDRTVRPRREEKNTKSAEPKSMQWVTTAAY